MSFSSEQAVELLVLLTRQTIAIEKISDNITALTNAGLDPKVGINTGTAWQNPISKGLVKNALVHSGMSADFLEEQEQKED